MCTISIYSLEPTFWFPFLNLRFRMRSYIPLEAYILDHWSKITKQEFPHILNSQWRKLFLSQSLSSYFISTLNCTLRWWQSHLFFQEFIKYYSQHSLVVRLLESFETIDNYFLVGSKPVEPIIWFSLRTMWIKMNNGSIVSKREHWYTFFIGNSICFYLRAWSC